MVSKKGLSAIALVAVLAIMSLTACGSQKAAVEQEKVKVVRGNIVQSVSADGELSLPQQRKLTFGIDGKIDVVNVEEGARVTRGQVLARLEPASLERAVKTAELAIKSAEADRQQAEAGVQSAQADLKQAEASVQTAQADQQQAEYAVKTAEANSKQAEYGVKTAESDLQKATDDFRKVSYPYTYATFNLNVPDAIAAIHDAQLKLDQARQGLNATPGSNEYLNALNQFQLAQDSLTSAQQSLQTGVPIENFGATVTRAGSTSTVYAIGDLWTIQAAQLAVGKAKLGVDTAKGALTIAQLAVNTANSALVKAQWGTEGAKAAVAKAQSGVQNAQAVLSKARLAVDNARYNLDTARERLDKAAIAAPFDGVIAAVNVKAGDVLTPVDYNRTIFELIDPRRMEFAIKVDEIDIPGIDVGQEAAVSIDALPGLNLKGKVSFVSPLPTVEGGVVQYRVKIGFDVPEGSALKSGMSSTANIVIGQRSNVLLVPNRAITQSQPGKPTVRVVVGGQAQERAVKTGVSNSLNTEILSGLSEGDTVIIERPAQGGSTLFGG